MINITEAIYKLYPSVIRTVGDVAFDVNGNEVAYDLQTVTAKPLSRVVRPAVTADSCIIKISAIVGNLARRWGISL